MKGLVAHGCCEGGALLRNFSAQEELYISFSIFVYVEISMI